jgi:hypothetical protein
LRYGGCPCARRLLDRPPARAMTTTENVLK